MRGELPDRSKTSNEPRRAANSRALGGIVEERRGQIAHAADEFGAADFGDRLEQSPRSAASSATGRFGAPSR